MLHSWYLLGVLEIWKKPVVISEVANLEGYASIYVSFVTSWHQRAS